MMSYTSMRHGSTPWWQLLRITWKTLEIRSRHIITTNELLSEETLEKPLFTMISLLPPTTTTTITIVPSTVSRGGGGGAIKGKVKIRMMRNKTSYRRLASIYEDTKGKL